MTVQYEGGYFLHSEPLVRGYGANAHTAKDLSSLSEYTVEAVNHIQDTPWAVNKFILSIATGFQGLGHNLTIKTRSGEQVILRLERPLDPRYNPANEINRRFSNSEWQSFSKEQKQEFKKKRAKALKTFEEDFGVYIATKRIIASAEEMSQFDKFYFPHNMDFRTRIYPIPSDLTPQSNDLSKGLLRFARGTTIGEQGYFWLGVMAASHWGEDKLSPEDRYRFALKTFREWQKFVDDPIENQGWLEADKPWQFLATCYEWVWANRLDNPHSYVSYLPGNLDGSCNGAQHLSILARDLVGAEATNCRNMPSRKDLYMEVADRVWEKVQQAAKDGHPLAIEWSTKLMEPSDRRKVVKRSVMTVPYGVTDYGVADFMIKDKHVDDKAENQWDSAKYMRDLIMASIDATLSNGRKLQLWFSACAQKCAENGLPLIWDTPSGSKVTQAYRNIVAKRINAFNTRFYIYEEPDEDEDPDSFFNRVGMDEKKMYTAAPPNVVHSCDAAHLQITVCRMAEAGIRDFSMIHDSFGCPMAQVGLMRDILRQTIVDMYEDNYLLTFKESVERYTGIEMPEPPALGDFDINEILDSEFFFA